MTVCVFDPRTMEMVADKVTIAGGLYSGQVNKITQFSKGDVVYTLALSGTCWLGESVRDTIYDAIMDRGSVGAVNWLPLQLKLVDILKKVGEIDNDPNVFDGLLVAYNKKEKTVRVFKFNNSMMPFEFSLRNDELISVGTPELCLAVQHATHIMRQFSDSHNTTPYSVPYIISELHKFHCACKDTDIDIVDVRQVEGEFRYVR